MSTLVVQTTVELLKFVHGASFRGLSISLWIRYKILRLVFFKKLLVPVEGYPGNPNKPEPLQIKMIPQETSIY